MLLSRSGGAIAVGNELSGDGSEGSVTDFDDLAALVETTVAFVRRLDEITDAVACLLSSASSYITG